MPYNIYPSSFKIDCILLLVFNTVLSSFDLLTVYFYAEKTYFLVLGSGRNILGCLPLVQASFWVLLPVLVALASPSSPFFE